MFAALEAFALALILFKCTHQVCLRSDHGSDGTQPGVASGTKVYHH